MENIDIFFNDKIRQKLWSMAKPIELVTEEWLEGDSMARKAKWYEPIQTALTLNQMRQAYAYFYGAKGQKLTKETMDALVKAEPEYFKRYSKAEMEQIYRNSLNKIGLDCSGFVVSCISHGCPVTYSTALYNATTDKTTPAAGPACSLLYTDTPSRHIGLDIGYGFYADMGCESTDAAVAAGMDSVRIRMIKGSSFTKSGRSPYVDYHGATT